MAAWKHLVAALLVSLCCIKSSYAGRRINCECGLPSSETLKMRIVGGRQVAPHTLPWLVAIRKDGNMHCGGAVVSDRHILSAGHCFKWDDYRRMLVLLGMHDMQRLSGVETRKITKSVIHENFKSNAIRDEHDIAMLTLDRPVVFNNKIRPICLPGPGQDFTGFTATIAGWGRTAQAHTSSKELLKANIQILSTSECTKEPRMAKEMTASMICGYAKGRDGCQGDSGGPMMALEPSGKYVQVGIVSWGIGCADPRYPGVYTKVSMYTSWINQQMAGGTTCIN